MILHFTTLNEWQENLILKNVSGYSRSIARIYLLFNQTIYSFFITESDLWTLKPIIAVESDTGDEEYEVKKLVTAKYWPNAVEAFKAYQKEWDFKKSQEAPNA